MPNFSFSLYPDSTVYQDYCIDHQGKITLSDPLKAVQDRIYTRLYTELSEWFLDTRIGLPYQGNNSLLGSKLPTDQISAIIKAQILDVDGVQRMTQFNLEQTGRTLSIHAEVITTTGENLEITAP